MTTAQSLAFQAPVPAPWEDLDDATAEAHYAEFLAGSGDNLASWCPKCSKPAEYPSCETCGFDLTGEAEADPVAAPPAGMLEAALAYAAQGIPVFPCDMDKKPLVPHGFKNASNSEQVIRAWWRIWPDALIGRPTGAASGVAVLDVDEGLDRRGRVKVGGASLASLVAQHGPLPDTIEALTPRGGRHIYFRDDPEHPLRSSQSKVGMDLDIRGDGGYVIVPPSQLPDGRAYEWELSGHPDDVPLAPVPEWLRELAGAGLMPGGAQQAASLPQTQVTEDVLADLRSALYYLDPCSRDTWIKVAHALRTIPDADGWALWSIWSRGDLHPDFPDVAQEARKLWGSASAVENRKTWESCRPTGTDYRAIFAEAARNGWVNPAGGGNSPSTPEPWPDPEELPKSLPSVAGFDLALLPHRLRPWIQDIADRMQCPAEFPAVATMVCLSSVIGRQIGIRPKRLDDWTVVPNLWGAIVGRPSLLKSPSLQEPMKLLDRLEMDAMEAYQDDLREFKAGALLAEEIGKATKRDIAKNLGDKAKAFDLARNAVNAEPDQVPQRRRYRTNDATVEKLGEMLAANPRGMLVFRDELVGWLSSLDKEGREGTRAFFLEAWNGTGRFTFDRVGRGTTDIEAACVSVLGGIQPGPLESYLSGALGTGVGDDGLLQRFQLLVWPDPPSTWKNVDRRPDTEAKQGALAIIERLDEIDPQALGATQYEGDLIPWVRFADDAQGLFDDWRLNLETRLLARDLPPALESHLAKYRSLIPSLALICHLVDHPEGGAVGRESLIRACAWGQFLETHAERLYSQARTPEILLALELDKHLTDLGKVFSVRDVYRKGWKFLDQAGAASAVQVLVKYGRVRPYDAGGKGRPTENFEIHPSLVGEHLRPRHDRA